MAIKRYAGDRFTGLSTDVKPMSVQNGAVFIETDTGKYFLFADGWEEISYHPRLTEVKTETGTSYTLALADINHLIRFDNASAITVTVPAEASVDFPTGANITLEQTGAGLLSVTAASGVTINAYGGLDSYGQYAGLSLIKVGSDTWTVYGGTA